jgi:hypothetical protein
MWLESRIQEEEGRQFSAYSVVIPNLAVLAGKDNAVAEKAPGFTNGAAH